MKYHKISNFSNELSVKFRLLNPNFSASFPRFFSIFTHFFVGQFSFLGPFNFRNLKKFSFSIHEAIY